MVATLLLLLRDESWSSTHTEANNKSHTSSLYGIANMGSVASSANIIIMCIKRREKRNGGSCHTSQAAKEEAEEKKTRWRQLNTSNVCGANTTAFVITLNYVWRKKNLKKMLFRNVHTFMSETHREDATAQADTPQAFAPGNVPSPSPPSLNIKAIVAGLMVRALIG